MFIYSLFLHRKWGLPQADMNIMFRSLSRLCDVLMNFFSEVSAALISVSIIRMCKVYEQGLGNFESWVQKFSPPPLCLFISLLVAYLHISVSFLQSQFGSLQVYS